MVDRGASNATVARGYSPAFSAIPFAAVQPSFLMPKYTLNVNGQPKTVDVAADTPLLWVLRDNLELVGTKFGCGIGKCGACTVHLNGVPTRSCMTTVNTVGRKQVVTIEGLSADGSHPVQKAWTELDVAQCGYCQTGQIMTAAALLKENPKPTDQDIDDAMDGNLCRCATYTRIRQGIKLASGTPIASLANLDAVKEESK
jgi:isoquinoline 1-oxidoreductase alpha subunit